jgi:putative addiction module killer protein
MVLCWSSNETEDFRRWRTALKDDKARSMIAIRLQRLAFGHTGDVKPIGSGINEFRIHLGPGYRIYFERRGSAIIVLLCGGDKGSQKRDIKTAMRLALEWEE